MSRQRNRDTAINTCQPHKCKVSIFGYLVLNSHCQKTIEIGCTFDISSLSIYDAVSRSGQPPH